MPSSVLLVECYEDRVANIANGLRQAGFHVTTVTDTLSALDLLGPEAWYDVLVTRIRPHAVMPHGFALARMALARHPHMRVLYITRFEVPEDERQSAVGPILIAPVTAEDVVRELEILVTSISMYHGS